MPLIELKEATSRSFDYVVVGGGTAGLTLAARLTEDAQISVLVLEAGEENLNDPLINNISPYGLTIGNPEYDWCLLTSPQTHANNTPFLWSRGRVLGGSSALNFTAWNKPSREDIDAWEKLGNKGWNWDRFDKYMQRATTYTPPNLSEAEYARQGIPEQVKKLWAKGVVGNGPVQVSHPPQRIDVDIKAQYAFRNMGIPMAPAPLDGDPNGVVFGSMSVHPKTILRSFAANAYWEPNSSRPNFNLLTGAVAHRLTSIMVDGELVITGVEFSHKSNGEQIYTISPSKEIVLCTGTLKTPQILELSGIGRPSILGNVGIPVKLALEGVGENIQEHANAEVCIALKEGIPDDTYDVLRDPAVAKKHKELFTKGQGLHTMGFSNLIFAPLISLSDHAQELISANRKRIEAEIAAGKYSPAIVDQYRILLDRLESGVPTCEIIGFPGAVGVPADPTKKYYTIVAALNSLFSRGTIHVTSSDPKVQAKMDPHYFEQEFDLKQLVDVVKFCRKIPSTAPLKDCFDEIPGETKPGPDIKTDEEMTDYLRGHSASTFHTIGSASMLPREKGGVVDTKLKVYGTRNLRIADLSIVPLHFGSHSQSVAYGIGEIAADIIKGIA